MKRTELKRKAPLKAGAAPARKPMKRKAKRKKQGCRWRSEAYLKFVRSLPCSACGTTQGVIAHHMKGIWHLSGERLKAPDSFCMPLCDGPGDACHRKVHNEAVYRDQQPDYLRRTLRAAFKAGFDTGTADQLTHALAFVEAKEGESA